MTAALDRTGRRRFLLHYVEMVVAMLAGMVVLGGALRLVLAAAGVEYSMLSHPELTIVEMAVTMILGMAGWMRFRGHAWPGTLEMCGAMAVPAVAVLVPVWLGVLTPARRWPWSTWRCSCSCSW